MTRLRRGHRWRPLARDPRAAGGVPRTSPRWASHALPVLAFALLLGCASTRSLPPPVAVPDARVQVEPPPRPEPQPEPALPAEERWLDDVLARADSLHGARRVEVDGQSWRSDCSGFVEACYAAAGLDLNDLATGLAQRAWAMWQGLEQRGQLVAESAVQPGDLVFFDNTTDRNRNGLRDDDVTHVGLVSEVRADGTIIFLHHMSGLVRRDPLHLGQPGVHRDPTSGDVLNAYLRRGRRGARLAGALVRGFGRP